ncbi:site-specific integrase [Oscillibacter valericigenes]|uniref:tyrosine-type recombinase/integrase n=1 Tax=Oscillibacter valericigenes TaxID=351091 RepID=UPI001F1E9E8D|nr:tyrosine-type recombinase/integrase [Oscillibacter valericigenes]MCF2617782.1 site-specific integrase [Oscillibacter valericigenes]
MYGYQNIVRRHLLPALGDIPLKALTPLQIQTYLSIKLGEGLSANTVLKHYHLLRTALGQAVHLGLLEVNPSCKVTPPRLNPTQYTCYSPQQIRILFKATGGTPLGLAIRLATYLGLRRSEITGLRWQCVDLKAHVILIQEVRTEVGGREVLKEPKTKRSIRRLGIGGCTELITELERAWTIRKSDDPAEFVLLRADGTPPSPDLLTRQMACLIEKYRLPKITLHGLRHSFASIANSQHIPMHDISHILGHSSITVTSSIYTHLFDETESTTLRIVAEAIRG